MKETNIDCMKYRKSTHLAGVDVESRMSENGNCILTIKNAYYEKNVDVCGRKTDGYFLEFAEDVKPMIVNSTNRKTIANIVKDATKCTTSESRNIGRWVGLKLELFFDENVKMKGEEVGGIRIKQKSFMELSDKNAITILSASTNLAELQQNWTKLNLEEKKLPTVLALKETKKAEYEKAQ